MKVILILVASLMTSMASAAPTFQVNDFIAGEVISVEPLCPAHAFCITNGTILRVQFTFTNGCESLKSLNATILEDGVELAAVRSIQGDICTMAMKYPVETVTLVGIYPPFTLAFKGTNVSLDVDQYSK
jgi:hypothetical protein